MKSQDIKNNAETGCCPRFNPEAYDEKEIVFENKLFVKDTVWCLFHFPLNFGAVMTRVTEKVDAVSGFTPEFLALAHDSSPWRSDVYVAVEKDIPGAEMVHLSGIFLTKVFEGPYSDMRKWMPQMEEFIESKGKTVQKMYAYYTTCPKCAKHYGKNFVVLFAKVG